jgi:hypothetical protein
MVAAAIGGSAIIGAGASIFGSSQASNAQQSAASGATNAELSMFNVVRNALAPYINQGAGAAGKLQDLTGTGTGGNPLTAYLTKPFNPTMADLENTPGYKFTLDQGLKTVNSQLGSEGWARSGPGIKAGANYAENLASTTYQNQFNNNLATQQQIYNMLFGQSNQGESAAAGVGNAAVATGNSIGSNLIGSGNAQAANWLNVGNSVGSAASGGLSGYLYNQLFQQAAANPNAIQQSPTSPAGDRSA